MNSRIDPRAAREALSRARLMLVFSPELCVDRDPLAVLEATLPWVDAIQIRPKPARGPSGSEAPCAAGETHAWCVRVLDLLTAQRDRRTLVLVDDRVDVAAVLWERGCAGVHLGQDDCPVAAARALLGSEPLVGLSTHDAAQVAHAAKLQVDYVGFGPIHATATKGYTRGVGAEACAAASALSVQPLFAIGGIGLRHLNGLARVGRVAVSSAILCAADPGRAAREMRTQLAIGAC